MCQIRILTVTFLIFLFVPLSSFSADKISNSSTIVVNLSLEQAIEMALKESEDVKIKNNEIDRNQRRYDEALSTVYPHFKGEIVYEYNPKVPVIKAQIDPTLPPTEFPMKQDFNFRAGITLEQTIFTFGRVSTALKVAKNASEISSFDKESKEREVSYRAAVAYMSVLLADRALQIAKDSYENAKLNKTLLEKKSAFGRVPKRDNIKIEADIASRVPSFKNAESDLDLAQRSLKTFIGLKEEESIKLTDTLTLFFPNYVLKDALKEMSEIEPTLKLLSKSVNLYDNIAVIRKSYYYPSIDGYASYSLYGESGKSYIGADNFMNIATLGLKISIPIWNGGQTGSIYKQALIDKYNAELELAKAKKGFGLELKNSISKYYSLIDTYKANEEALKLSERSYNFSKDRFQSGEVTLADLNDEELRLTASKLHLELTKYSINETIAKIERLISGKGEKSWKSRLQYNGEGEKH